MSLRDQLQSIYESHGRLTSSLLVSEARSEDHPLHNRFEWDNTVAGEKYRRVQAAELIRSVKVAYVDAEPDNDAHVRAFHAVPKPDGSTYIPIEEIAEDPFTAELVLKAAEREWRTLYRRYSHLSQFLSVVRRDVAVGA